MLVLRDLTILQKTHPSPPIMHLGEARMSVQWFDLVRGFEPSVNYYAVPQS
jgi:hypothetical protein